MDTIIAERKMNNKPKKNIFFLYNERKALFKNIPTLKAKVPIMPRINGTMEEKIYPDPGSI